MGAGREAQAEDTGGPVRSERRAGSCFKWKMLSPNGCLTGTQTSRNIVRDGVAAARNPDAGDVRNRALRDYVRVSQHLGFE